MSEDVTRCRFCGEEILAVAVKCKHCGSDLTETHPARPESAGADYGVLLLAIPVIATMLVWFWVGSMNLLQSPSSSLTLILLFTVFGTALVGTLEASKAGMRANGKQGSYSPTQWFFILSLIWIIGYPVYLFKRRRYGLKNHVVLGLAGALIFVTSWCAMSAAIWEQKAELRHNLGAMQQSFDSWSD